MWKERAWLLLSGLDRRMVMDDVPRDQQIHRCSNGVRAEARHDPGDPWMRPQHSAIGSVSVTKNHRCRTSSTRLAS